jgi:hypothetical protein
MSDMSLKKIVLLMAAACLCVVFLVVFLKKYSSVFHPLTEADYPIARHVRYNFTLQNTNNKIIKDAEFWAYAPVKQTPTQLCLDIETSHPYQLISDTIKADLKLADVPNPMREKHLKQFIRAEKYIESDHPELSNLAKNFKDSNPIKMAEKAFQWVTDNLEYTGFSAKDRGALYAIKNKKGDCTEYMYLFAALCRANKIPCRCLGGYFVENDCILLPSAYHNWAEFYDEGKWWIADAQKKFFKEKSSSYIVFNLIDNSTEGKMGSFRRFRTSGNGLKAKMNK